jgi:hypothetical protein
VVGCGLEVIPQAAADRLGALEGMTTMELRQAIEVFLNAGHQLRLKKRAAEMLEKFWMENAGTPNGDQWFAKQTEAKDPAIAAHEAVLESGQALKPLLAGHEAAARHLAKYLFYLDWRTFQVNAALECWGDLAIELDLLLHSQGVEQHVTYRELALAINKDEQTLRNIVGVTEIKNAGGLIDDGVFSYTVVRRLFIAKRKKYATFLPESHAEFLRNPNLQSV